LDTKESRRDTKESRREYEQIINDIYCNAVVQGWRRGKQWEAEGKTKWHKEQEENFIKKQKGSGSNLEQTKKIKEKIRKQMNQNHHNNIEISESGEQALAEFKQRRRRNLESDEKRILKENEDIFWRTKEKKKFTLADSVKRESAATSC
jgi:hypothetical protein